jgi:4'-phosphopantetheinyl transferase
MKPWALWLSPPEQVLLGAHDIHVWRISLEQPAEIVEALGRLLSTDESKRAQRFHFERDRKHFIVARGTLRRLIGRYLAAKPESIRFTYQEYGKPHLAADSLYPTLKFNLAHSGSLAVFAFTRLGEIGVDLEQIKPELAGEDIARRFFSESEVASLEALPESERAVAFFNCWTRKEAFIKAKGLGLSLPLDQFDVTLIPGHDARLLRTAWDESEAERWSIRALDVAEDYAGALAIENHDGKLSCWECDKF